MSVKERLGTRVPSQEKNSAPSTETPLPDNGTSILSFSQEGSLARRLRRYANPVFSMIIVLGLAAVSTAQAAEPTPTPTSTPTPTRLALTSPDNPYYWVRTSDGARMRATIYHGTAGFGSNASIWRVDTIEQCAQNFQTLGYGQCVLWQPDGKKIPATQSSPYIGIAVAGIVAKNFNSTDVGYLALAINKDLTNPNIYFPLFIRAGDLNSPSNYSLQSEYHQGLPQGGTFGDTYSNLLISLDSKLQVWIKQSINPSEDGLYQSPLDNRGDFSGNFLKQQALPPTLTPTPTHTPTFSVFNIYIPVVARGYRGGW